MLYLQAEHHPLSLARVCPHPGTPPAHMDTSVGRLQEIAYFSPLFLSGLMGFPGGSEGGKKKKSACNAGDPGLILRSGRSPGEGNGYLLQYSCLENSMDRRAWWATVHGVRKSQTQLSNRRLSLSLSGLMDDGRLLLQLARTPAHTLPATRSCRTRLPFILASNVCSISFSSIF